MKVYLQQAAWQYGQGDEYMLNLHGKDFNYPAGFASFYSCENDEQPTEPNPPPVEPTNLPPVATDVLITFEGGLQAGVQLSVSYVYTDAEGDSEANTVIQWYPADDNKDTNTIAIDGASSHDYTVQAADEENI
jgi:hypothetical protein